MIKVSKYQNINGITCYMNSILHILQNIDSLIEYINKDLYLEIINNKDCNKKWIMVELANLFKLSYNNPNNTISPVRFRNIIGLYDDRWIDNEQQDSSDFLDFILSKIQEEVGINTNKIPKFTEYSNNSITSIKQIMAYKSYLNYYSNEYSPLKKLFTNFNKYNKICGFCNNESSRYESHNILQLSIPERKPETISETINIYDCLEYLTNKIKMSNNDLYDCEKCCNKTYCYDKTTLWLIPEILIISFKRFDNNMRKNNININYPIENLDLSKFFDNETPHVKNNLYDLIAVNMHFSLGGINSGHYVSIIKHNDKWILYNDENPIQEVNNHQFKEAYILFYKLKKFII